MSKQINGHIPVNRTTNVLQERHLLKDVPGSEYNQGRKKLDGLQSACVFRKHNSNCKLKFAHKDQNLAYCYQNCFCVAMEQLCR